MEADVAPTEVQFDGTNPRLSRRGLLYLLYRDAVVYVERFGDATRLGEGRLMAVWRARAWSCSVLSRAVWPNKRDISPTVTPLGFRGNDSATSNNMKLVHWPLMDGLLHLVQRGGDWAGPQPAQAPPRCTNYNSSPINGQCTNHRMAV